MSFDYSVAPTPNCITPPLALERQSDIWQHKILYQQEEIVVSIPHPDGSYYAAQIWDIAGRLIWDSGQLAQSHVARIRKSEFPTGVYVLTISSGKSSVFQKILL